MKILRVSLTKNTDPLSGYNSYAYRKYKNCRQFSTLAQMLQVYSSGNGTTNAQSYPPKEVVVAGSAKFCFDDIATPNDRSQG